MVPLLLAGPAGSGKTHRCLAEIADHLRKSAVGAPLILIAPRQATYQLERQILSVPGVDGFTRLKILSFQRLAQFVFETTGSVAPKLLDEDGRVMVMRAILARRRNQLRVYRDSAQRDGLAQEVSDLWREVCEHRAGPQAFRRAAEKLDSPRLRAKLEDFVDIFEDYAAWLKEHALRDGEELLDIAADAIEAGPMPKIAGLWVDGFAQMTPQERRLLTVMLPKCEAATLAFCLPERPLQPGDAFSMWSVVARTYCGMRDQLKSALRQEPREETLARRKIAGRFDAAPMLAHIEACWGTQNAFEAAGDSVRVVKCVNVEAEANFTAREILKFVRAGGRFREAAVLARSLDHASDALRRAFHRYQIPFFLDRREAVGHHPLAELTRGALRAIAFGFKHSDLFAALKSGLIGIPDEQVDWFENMSLARGWTGGDWRGELNCGPKAQESEWQRVEDIRARAMKPIFALERKLGAEPSGAELAAALRDFWMRLDVEAQLDHWAEAVEDSLHANVWTQMSEWLESVELAFGREKMTTTGWLEIVEAGLASLTVGLIPPSLDQTLIGAVDRSRNPDLRAVFLVGVNEGLFPKTAGEAVLLSDADRDTLAETGLHLGTSSLWDLGAEQFYGYIACTRARSSLTITYSELGADGEPVNPSLFIGQLQRQFPALKEESFTASGAFDAEAAHELNSLIFAAARRGGPKGGFEEELRTWPCLATAWERARNGITQEFPNLSASAVKGLYGNRLKTSVSKLEQFAMCPFRFFVASGLRAQERMRFELDRREEGSFQHEILAAFHKRVEEMGKRWRDISPQQGRELVSEIGASMKTQFQDGLAEATAANRFRAHAKVAALQDFVEAYLELLRGCEFDPRHVELGFGGKGPLAGWELQIDETRAVEFVGRIDRVDVWIDPEAKRCYALVYDYKSSEKKLHRLKVKHAIQQQLPAYLVALQKIGGRELFPFEVRAGGAFYVNLRVRVRSAKTRAAAFDPAANESDYDLKQSGVFDWGLIDKLDRQGNRRLFDYSTTKNGPRESIHLKALPSTEFAQLLNNAELALRDLGRRVFEGEIAMNPYQLNTERACENCLYGGICRVDPWTHNFRDLEQGE